MSVVFLQSVFLKTSFYGRNGQGTISVPGVKSGDIILVAAIAGTQPLTSQFIPIVAADDEIEQTYAGDNTSNLYTAVLLRSSEA